MQEKRKREESQSLVAFLASNIKWESVVIVVVVVTGRSIRVHSHSSLLLIHKAFILQVTQAPIDPALISAIIPSTLTSGDTHTIFDSYLQPFNLFQSVCHIYP